MKFFNSFDASDGQFTYDHTFHSRFGQSCHFREGFFNFYSKNKEILNEPPGIFIGNSDENKGGGLGGFAGKNDEYFFYCGEDHPEIAVARFSTTENKWKRITQWQYSWDDEVFYDCGIEWFDKYKCAFPYIWRSWDREALYFMPHARYFKGEVLVLYLKKEPDLVRIPFGRFSRMFDYMNPKRSPERYPWE